MCSGDKGRKQKIRVERERDQDEGRGSGRLIKGHNGWGGEIVVKRDCNKLERQRLIDDRGDSDNGDGGDGSNNSEKDRVNYC